MKKNPFYTLKTISGKAQLLPFGQAVAAQMPAVELCGSGGLLWSLIDRCEDEDIEELIRLAVSEMDLEGSEKTAAEADMRQFIRELISLGILEDDDPIQKAAGQGIRFSDLLVGPMRVEFRGEAGFFHPDFGAFLIPADENRSADQVVAISGFQPPFHAGLTCLLQNSELEVYQGEDRILMRFPTMPGVKACLLTPDGSYAVFYVSDPGDMDRLKCDLFHAIRHAALYRAERLGLFALHSASILYRDRVWLFSASAGTGKSTHAALWQEAFDTPVINGDLALLSVSEQGPLFHPVPWCGTSGISLNETHPLGGIIFLRQGKQNSVRELEPDQRQMRLANRIISPVWTEKQLTDRLGFSKELSYGIGMWELTCTPETEAAVCMKAAIDSYLEEVSADVR